MRSHPDRELNHLIAQLERIFLAFCGVEHNQVLTRKKIAGLILETLKGEARERYRDTLSDFATLYRADLEAIYRKIRTAQRIRASGKPSTREPTRKHCHFF